MAGRSEVWLVGAMLGLAPVAGCAHWGPPRDVATRRVQETRSDSMAVESPQAPMVATTAVEQKLAPAEDRTLESRLTSTSADVPRLHTEQRASTQRPQLDAKLEPPETTLIQRGPRATPETEPVVDALRCVLENRPSDALQYLQKYDRPTQEMFLRLLPVLGLLTQKGMDQMSPPEVAGLNEQVQSLCATIRPYSRLAIDEACFCEWIESTGIYKRLPEGHAFLCSTNNRQGDKALLYVELSNFASVFKDGYFTTQLASSLELRDQNGKVVWSRQGFSEEDEPIRSWKLLRDYHNKYLIPMPHNLPPGTYELTIQVTDKTLPNQPPRVARKTVEMRLTAMSPRSPDTKT